MFIKIIKRFFFKKNLDDEIGKNKGYLLSDTCQVPNLANIYKLYLGLKSNGFFVDCGAYDGEYASNTSGLADFGWNGLCIEPVREYCIKCKQRHRNNKVKVINCAIGDKNGSTEINVGGPLSTIKNDVVKKFNCMDWSKGFHRGEKETVEMKKLDIILTEEDVPKRFDVLSIDVEGYEWEVLKNFNIKMWSPKIVIIELHDNNVNYDLEWKDCNKLVQYFDKNGYRVVFKDFCNTVYIKNDSLQIKLPAANG